MTISSPLEAHKQRAIIHSMVGVDVGFENPLFAALEVDYGESDQDPTGEAFKAAEKVRSLGAGRKEEANGTTRRCLPTTSWISV